MEFLSTDLNHLNPKNQAKNLTKKVSEEDDEFNLTPDEEAT
jgi:hypothetical protein